MKNISLIAVLLAITALSSCSVVGDIFKAGMWWGIFLVVAFIGLIIFIIGKASSKDK